QLDAAGLAPQLGPGALRVVQSVDADVEHALQVGGDRVVEGVPGLGQADGREHGDVPAVADVEHGDVQRAAAHVEDQHPEPVRPRRGVTGEPGDPGRHRLVDQRVELDR